MIFFHPQGKLHCLEDAMNQDLLRKIPSVDSMMQSPEIESLSSIFGRDMAAGAVRAVLEGLRDRIRAGETPSPDEMAIPALAAHSEA